MKEYVYVVTTGEYDYYRIVAVYKNQKQAEAMARKTFLESTPTYVEKYAIGEPGSTSRYTENQIKYKTYDRERGESDYLTGDEHFQRYMSWLKDKR